MLEEISNLEVILVPKVIDIGVVEEVAYLVLAWFDLKKLNNVAAVKFGEGLSIIHSEAVKHLLNHLNLFGSSYLH